MFPVLIVEVDLKDSPLCLISALEKSKVKITPDDRMVSYAPAFKKLYVFNKATFKARMWDLQRDLTRAVASIYKSPKKAELIDQLGWPQRDATPSLPEIIERDTHPMITEIFKRGTVNEFRVYEISVTVKSEWV